jgi:hypothetical protein
MVKLRVKVSILATIDTAAKQAGMNRSRFMRAASLAFDPSAVHPAQVMSKASVPAVSAANVAPLKPKPVRAVTPKPLQRPKHHPGCKCFTCKPQVASRA